MTEAPTIYISDECFKLYKRDVYSTKILLNEYMLENGIMLKSHHYRIIITDFVKEGEHTYVKVYAKLINNLPNDNIINQL